MKTFLLNFSIIALISTAVSAAECEKPNLFNYSNATGYRSLNTTSYGYQMDQTYAFKGKRSERFEVRPGDCGTQGDWDDCSTDRERSEISVDSYKPNPNETFYLSFALRLDENWTYSKYAPVTLGQIHQRGGVVNYPVLTFTLTQGYNVFACHPDMKKSKDSRKHCRHINLTNGYIPRAMDALKGKWNYIKAEINGKENYAQIWMNGDYKGKLDLYLRDHNPQEFFLKYGIYRSRLSRHKNWDTDQPERLPTQIAWFDEVRFSNKDDFVSTLRCNLDPKD